MHGPPQDRAAQNLAICEFHKRSRTAAARIRTVDLARIAWLAVVLICLITVLILVLQGYWGYAGVTFAVAVAAALNLF
jgi:hypothetical protein